MADIIIKDTRMETGMELPTIKDALISPKNKKIMSIGNDNRHNHGIFYAVKRAGNLLTVIVH